MPIARSSLKKHLASFLGTALVLLSPGVGFYHAWAASFVASGGSPVVVGVPVVPAVGISPISQPSSQVPPVRIQTLTGWAGFSQPALPQPEGPALNPSVEKLGAGVSLPAALGSLSAAPLGSQRAASPSKTRPVSVLDRITTEDPIAERAAVLERGLEDFKSKSPEHGVAALTRFFDSAQTRNDIAGAPIRASALGVLVVGWGTSHPSAAPVQDPWESRPVRFNKSPSQNLLPQRGLLPVYNGIANSPSTDADRSISNGSLKSLFAKPAVRWVSLALAGATFVAALPWLAAHVAAVAAAGSIALSVIGVPQIVHIFKTKREGVKDLAIGSTLIWFAAAVLLSVVSIGNGSSFWWNVANVAGVAESAAVLGQVNYYKRDARDLKATALTAAASLAPLPLIALKMLLPLSVWLTAAFWAAMALLWVLNWPQIRQNYRLYQAEGRPPKGISPLYPGLVVAGSAMHLYAALMGADMRWAMNASIAILTASIVLAQIYFPRAANAVVAPLIKLAEKLRLPWKK